MARAVASSEPQPQLSPKVMVPSARRLTRRPERPRVKYSNDMANLRWVNGTTPVCAARLHRKTAIRFMLYEVLLISSQVLHARRLRLARLPRHRRTRQLHPRRGGAGRYRLGAEPDLAPAGKAARYTPAPSHHASRGTHRSRPGTAAADRPGAEGAGCGDGRAA